MDNMQNTQGFGNNDQGSNPDPLGQSMPPAANQDPFAQMNNNTQNGFQPQADFSSTPYRAQNGFDQGGFNQGGFGNQNGFNDQNGFNNQGGFNNPGGYNQNVYGTYDYQPQGGYNQGGYQQGYDQQYYGQPQQLPTPGFSIASMIAGILGLVLFCCLRWWDLALCIPAIVLGIIGLVKEPNGKGFAITGIITGAIALILTIVIIVIWIAMARSIAQAGYTGFQQMWQEMIEEALQNP